MRIDDSLHLTPEERMREVAAILAGAVRALRESARREALGISPESTRNCLEVPRDLRLSGHRG